ncbi:MAG: hypothetical protein K6F52_06425 [Clostridia bacterium]|nr:hypothetical protein [Clostridia bacterium]
MKKVFPLLKGIAVFFEKNMNQLFSVSVEAQQRILNSFENPKDDIERSYFQYCCQIRMNKRIVNIMWNLASFLIYFFVRKKLITAANPPATVIHSRAVFFADEPSKNLVPKEVADEYGEIQITGEFPKARLREADVVFLNSIRKRYPRDWYFALKLMLKISQFRGIMDAFKPECILTCSEYSFTSSILHEYCSMEGVRIVNVQHGEKFYFIRDAFFHFDKCYLWSDYYVDMMKSLRAEESQFCVSVPQALVFPEEILALRHITFDYTYYLQEETTKELAVIKDSLLFLQKQGITVCLRPHPVFSNKEKIRRIFSEFEIQDNFDVSIEKSLMMTKYAVSAYSAVLKQALYNGVGVVVDDISNPSRYRKLKEYRYEILDNTHSLLSEILRGKQC